MARVLDDYLDNLIEGGGCEAIGGTPRLVGAHTPILLRDSHAIMVLEGHVDVFAVRVEDAEPVGTRHALFRVAKGEMLLALPACMDAAGDVYSLLAVGVAGTRLLDQLSLRTLSQLPKEHFAALLERYIGGLITALNREPLVGASTIVDAGETVEIFREVPVFGASRRPEWVMASGSEQLLVFGDDDLPSAIVAVTNACWMETTATTTVKVLDSLALIGEPNWQALVLSYLQVYGKSLSKALGMREVETRQRQAASTRLSEMVLDTALAGMRSTVLPGRSVGQGASTPSMEGPAEMSSEAPEAAGEPLHAAFLAVLQDLKVETGGAAKRVQHGRHNQAIEALALTYRVRTRKVLLRGNWWQTDVGPLLGYTEDDRDPVALIPTGAGGYSAWNPVSGQYLGVDEKLADDLHGEAFMIYRPLPEDTKSLWRFVQFVLPSLRTDLGRLALMGLAGGLLAAVVPVLTGVLIEEVLPRSDVQAHTMVVLALVAIALGGTSFEVVKAFALLRIEARADLDLQSALYDRILRLPVTFFRKYTAGDLADRVLGIQTIRQTLTGTTIQSLLSVTFSVFSLALLFYYSWQLALVACGLVILSVMVTVFLGLKQVAEERLRIAHQGEAEGFILQFLTGIAKLRIAAAETRAYARWAGYFTRQKRRFVSAQHYANQQEVFQSAFPVLATGIIFLMAAMILKDSAISLQLESLVSTAAVDDASLSTGGFVAFNTAFGQLLAALTTLAVALTRSLAVVPIFERLLPILQTSPETSEAIRPAANLRGGIELSHVSFRYSPEGPLVLDDLSLTIAPNEFVAIVGPSGSGKSTLVRLLLGFEHCESGEVLLDGSPLHNLDITSVRQQIRVVLQNNHLVTGSVFSNIVGSSTLTVDDAWHAARLAGLDEDIEALPMGMHTMLMEGVTTLSGGQRQRLMIARALVHRPTILLLDEPTSALDNRTQEKVMTSIAGLHATRIVIAHRMTTVQSADQILVIDGGRLVQQGRYEELLKVEGPFADMAKRQLLATS